MVAFRLVSCETFRTRQEAEDVVDTVATETGLVLMIEMED